MTTPKRRYSKEEFARRGDAIYEKYIEPGLKPKDKGKFVAIDIETGDFEIADEQLAASQGLRVRVPDAQIWMKRAGSKYLARFGKSTRTL